VRRWHVKLSDPIVTHGSYLSASELKRLYIKHYTFILLLLRLLYQTKYVLFLHGKLLTEHILKAYLSDQW